jgi:hypothetical protein
MLNRNTLLAKLLRQFTSLLPVSKSRRGTCVRCGNCCELPYTCPFLRSDGQGLSRCAAYPIRPSSCRKYPRTEHEHLTEETCGFRFE